MPNKRKLVDSYLLTSDEGTNEISSVHERKQQRRLEKAEGNELRRQKLSHDTKEKRDHLKTKLHLTNVQRKVATLKERLQNWDHVAETKREEQQQQASSTEFETTSKKKGRKGPETWKLKGAARPAWEVYDFDVRYVDPHMQAHQQAQDKAQRLQNILVLYKGRLGNAPDAPTAGRDYLALLMQLGHLSMEMKQYKGARAAFLECMELEGNDQPVMTTARVDLMRMYWQLDRLDAAYRFAERLPPDDTTVWIRYPLALLACRHQQHRSDEDDDGDDDGGKQQEFLMLAIRSNPFCAYYLAYWNTFSAVMEYTEDIENADDTPHNNNALLEAIEYCCCSDQPREWQKSPGALDALKSLLVQAAKGQGPLSPHDIEWSSRLTEIEAAYSSEEDEQRTTDCVDEGSEEEGTDAHQFSSNVVDVRMFAGMFRTGMEMLQESGQL